MPARCPKAARCCCWTGLDLEAVPTEGLGPLGSDRDDRHRTTQFCLDAQDVPLRVARQFAHGTASGDVLVPARQLLVERRDAAPVLGAHRQALERLAVDHPAVADLEGLDSGQDVQLGQRDVGDPGYPDRVAELVEVDPSAAARTTGRGAEFRSDLAHVLTDLVEQLGDERSATHAGGVGLHDSQHAGRRGRADAQRRVDRTAAGAGRGHVRVGPELSVQHRSLRSLEEDVAVARERVCQDQRRILHVPREQLSRGRVLLGQTVRREDHVRTEPPQHRLDRGEELLEQQDGIPENQVHDPDAEAEGRQGVRRTDPTEGGADLVVRRLHCPFQRQVRAQDELCPTVDDQAGGAQVAGRPELLDLGDQDQRIDHHAGPDDQRLPLVECAGRDQVQDGLLVADHQGVTGVVASLEPDDDVRALGQQVDQLSLAFVAPLGADYDDVCHRVSYSAH